MIRVHGQYIPVKSILLGVTETGVLLSCLWAAALVRFGSVGQLRWYMSQPHTLGKLLIVMFVCMTSLYYNDLYDLHVVYKRSELVIRLLQAIGAASLALAALYYLAPNMVIGRGITAIAAILTVMCLLLWRLVVDASDFFRPVERIVIAGTGVTGKRLVQELKQHPEMRFHVVGFLEDAPSRQEPLGDAQVVGCLSEVDQIVSREHVDRVVLSLSERRGTMPLKQLLRVRLNGTRIEDAHSMFEKLTGRIMLERLSPSELILSDGFRRTAIFRVIKRVGDIVLSIAALVILSPLMLLTALAIYVESGSPVFFRQKRIGLNDKPFWILKFRSMRKNAGDAGAVWASKTDPRITRVGAIIRRCRMDEVPQFINVLRGEMSVVGPRPEQPEIVERLEREIPYYSERHTVRPGITGWAQISYPYGASVEDAHNKLEYDLFYAKHLSAFFDLLILLRTAQVAIMGKGAV